MSSIDCTKCGAAYDEQVARCPLCGQPLAPTMPTKRSRRTVILTLSAIAGGVILLPCVGGVAPYLYKKLTNPSYILTYLGHAGMAQGAVWAPDGRRVASIGVNSTARVWEPFTGITLQTCQLEKDIEAASLSKVLCGPWMESTCWPL